VNFERDINWRSFVVCDVAFNSVNNWLWTPYIESGEAARLYIEIKFTMRDCNLFPQMVLSCKETFALLYKEVDGPIGSAGGQSSGGNQLQSSIGHQGQSTSGGSQAQLQANASSSFAQSDSYTLIDAIAAGEGRFTSNNDVVINTKIRSIPVSKRGVYFAFRDQGACLSLISIKVYYLRCPQLVANFAKFNATPTGRDLSSLVAVEGECVANAVQVEQPRMFCTADGQWNSMSSGQCKCLPGFEPAANGTKCVACPAGKFKWQLGEAQCSPCPERSYAPGPGATECKCHEGFFRSPRDPRWWACSQPPASGPSNLSASHVDSSLVVLQWQAPKFAGGREDLFYRLVCDNCPPGEQQIVSSPPALGANFTETKCVLAGLQPATSYRFLVYALNGVSQLAGIHNKQPAAYAELTIQTAPRPQAPTGSGQNSAAELGPQFQTGQQQQLPLFNFRAVPGARGTDMILAWDTLGPAAGSGTPATPTSEQAGQASADEAAAPALFEIRFQALRGAATGALGALSSGDPFAGAPLARRSPYAGLLGQGGVAADQHPQSQAQQQMQQQMQLQQQQQLQLSGSLSTTNRVVGLYALHPRTEYSFQIRAKLGPLQLWTDWSEPLVAATGAPTSMQVGVAPLVSPPGALEATPSGLAPAQFLDVLGNQMLLPAPPGQQPQPGPGGDPRAFLFQTQPSAGGPAPAGQSWASLAAGLLFSLAGLLLLLGLLLLGLVRYRKWLNLRPLASQFGGGGSVFGHHQHHSNGGSSSSTYAGVYSGAGSNDLVVGANPFSSSTITTTANGNHLIYHNAAIAQQQQHYGHFGSPGTLITGSNSTSRSSSAGVVQSFLAATLGQLTGGHQQTGGGSGNGNQAAANQLQQAGPKASSKQQHHHHTIGQDGKLFIHSAGTIVQPNGHTLGAHNSNGQETLQTARNHYHQMLTNTNHTLLFGGSPTQTNQNGPNSTGPNSNQNQNSLANNLNQSQQMAPHPFNSIAQQQDFYSVRPVQRSGNSGE